MEGPQDRSDDGLDDATVEAVGKASEALEYVERARGHLYSFHQLMGHADLVFGEAADLLREAGLHAQGDQMDDELVGLNVLDGRWTYQVIEEFDGGYHRAAADMVQQLVDAHLAGERHAYERRMKQERRTPGRQGHEMEPPGR